MRRDRRALLAIALVGAGSLLLLVLFALFGAALVGSTLADSEREPLLRLLQSRWPLLLLAALAVVAAAAALAPRGYQRWIAAPARLLEQARVLLTTDAQTTLSVDAATPALRGLADAINRLAAQRDQLKLDIAAQVDAASSAIEQERNRLATLMNELQQSVVVCNLDGRILLYNNRARLQFRALSKVPGLADGAELVGLGRSIHAVFDRQLVAHALERVTQQQQRGAANPSAQFVTATRTGQLLRARLAAVRGVASTPADAALPATINSFVLLLDDITADYEQQSARERLLHRLTEDNRGALANLQAAVELLDDSGLDAALRERFLGVIRDEVQSMSRRIDEQATNSANDPTTRWPLDEMRAADFVQAAQGRIDALAGLRCAGVEVDPALWLRLDSFSLLQALVYLSERVRDELSVAIVRLRLSVGDAQRARLDLLWSGPAISTETAMGWELDAIKQGGEAGPLTVREVVARHGGEFWFERDRARQLAFFRFLLPLAAPAAAESATEASFDSRPEFFDFDLFGATELGRELEDQPLQMLSFTVFDTETTGLDPSGGDEIIQIGAARIVRGKLLRNECFEQLVDPRRSIPQASVRIHGISAEQVVGMPTLDAVLPAFRAYAHDSVLVAHNAAFDMRFLQLKQAQLGISFDLPVLDTLLLSAVVHPHQTSHRLEAIAARFGIEVVARHSALGDALVTAEVLLKLIPLLAEQGIRTLGEARAAAQQTYYARLRY